VPTIPQDKEKRKFSLQTFEEKEKQQRLRALLLAFSLD